MMGSDEPVPRLHFAGPLDEEGLADATLVVGALVPFQRSHVRGRAVATVVTEEDHDSVVGQIQFIERLPDAADPVIDGLDHRGHGDVVVEFARWLGFVLATSPLFALSGV